MSNIISSIIGPIIGNIGLINSPGWSWFLSDGHHTLLELETQNWIMMKVLSGKIDIDDLNIIDRMGLYPKTLSIKIANYLIMIGKKHDISPKSLCIYGCSLFSDAYEERLKLLIALCNLHPDHAYKTLRHFDEENDPMFEGDFLVWIETPLGIVSYHLKRQYYSCFDVTEQPHGPEYEGYTSQEALFRLASLVNENAVKEHINGRAMRNKPL